MSYVSQAKKTSPVGLTGAIAINGSIIVAVLLSPTIVNTLEREDRIKVINVEQQKPPPDKPKDQVKETPFLPPVYAPPRIVNAVQPETVPPRITNELPFDPPPPAGTADGIKIAGAADIAKILPSVAAVPIFKAAIRDPRFARKFQPAYPVGLLRREIEGRVRIKVLIGASGRVRQAEIVSATHADFGKAARKQALRSWRFKPATRDGKPVEDWQTLTVRFNID